MSEGLALCTPSVRPQPDNCLSAAGCGGASDVGGETAEGCAGREGVRGKVLPQESQTLIVLRDLAAVAVPAFSQGQR